MKLLVNSNDVPNDMMRFNEYLNYIEIYDIILITNTYTMRYNEYPIVLNHPTLDL